MRGTKGLVLLLYENTRSAGLTLAFLGGPDALILELFIVK